MQIWDNYSIDDKEWNRLLDTIWNYQWNRTFTPLTVELRKRIYELTQGVPAFLIRLFHFAQRRAILLGDKEELTIEVFDETFDQSFGSVRGVIQAIASGDEALKDLFDDLPKSFSLEALLAKEAEEFRTAESIAMRKRVHRAGLQASRLAAKRVAFETALATPSRDGMFSSPANRIAKEAIEAGKDPFDALVEAGFLDKGLRK